MATIAEHEEIRALTLKSLGLDALGSVLTEKVYSFKRSGSAAAYRDVTEIMEAMQELMDEERKKKEQRGY